MTAYTRVSVVGATRRADVVIASAEPLGAVLPRLLELLDENGGTVARPLTFVGPDGEQLDIARTPGQLDLPDGALLQLVRLDAAPPPPVVIDVTDAAAEALEARPDRWDDRARAAAGGSGIALAAAVAGGLAPWDSPAAAAAGLLAVVAVLAIAAAGLGLGRLRRVSACAASAAGGAVLPLAAAATTALVASGQEDGPALLAALAAAIAAAGVVVLLGIGVAHRRRGAVAGGALGAVLGTLLLALVLLGVDAVLSAAVTGTVAAFFTGVLPWVSLSAAGLTGLDQRVADGERVGRPAALVAIDDAYAALSWGVAATAVVLGVAGVALAQDGTLWPGLLALALALVGSLRTRAFPLRVQGCLLWAAVAAIAVAATTTRLSGPAGVVVAAAAAVAIAAATLVRPRPHTRARLRGIGNVVEMIAVVALLPLLLGAMGVYSDLLGLFGGGS